MLPALLARRVRIAARAWVAVVTLTLLGAALAGWIPQSPDSRTFETAAQLGLRATAAGGGLLAWRWEGAGGAILLVCGVALGVLTSLQWPPLASLLVALGFILPAIAFLALWQGPRPGRHLAVLGATVTLVLLVGGVAADLQLLGIQRERPAPLSRLDPRGPARHLAVSWRVGRLRAALPAPGRRPARTGRHRPRLRPGGVGTHDAAAVWG